MGYEFFNDPFSRHGIAQRRSRNAGSLPIRAILYGRLGLDLVTRHDDVTYLRASGTDQVVALRQVSALRSKPLRLACVRVRSSM
jgi:hypothetical protein